MKSIKSGAVFLEAINIHNHEPKKKYLLRQGEEYNNVQSDIFNGVDIVVA